MGRMNEEETVGTNAEDEGNASGILDLELLLPVPTVLPLLAGEGI